MAADRVGEHGNVEPLGVLEQYGLVHVVVVGPGNEGAHVIERINLFLDPQQLPVAFKGAQELANILGHDCRLPA